MQLLVIGKMLLLLVIEKMAVIIGKVRLLERCGYWILERWGLRGYWKDTVEEAEGRWRTHHTYKVLDTVELEKVVVVVVILVDKEKKVKRKGRCLEAYY